MAKDIFTVGPVLSFRGISEKGQWLVTALIGVPKTNPFPALQIEGRICKPPVVLHEHRKERILRYDLTCEMHDEERKIEFGLVGDGPVWHFTIPGKGYAPRMAYVSCNGFSDPSSMRKLVSRENAVWSDLLCSHDSSLRLQNYLLDKEQLWHEKRIHDKGLQRFHLLLMGGDQIYFDSIWENH